jgi:hypothetical protein
MKDGPVPEPSPVPWGNEAVGPTTGSWSPTMTSSVLMTVPEVCAPCPVMLSQVPGSKAAPGFMWVLSKWMGSRGAGVVSELAGGGVEGALGFI